MSAAFKLCEIAQGEAGVRVDGKVIGWVVRQSDLRWVCELSTGSGRVERLSTLFGARADAAGYLAHHYRTKQASYE